MEMWRAGVCQMRRLSIATVRCPCLKRQVSVPHPMVPVPGQLTEFVIAGELDSASNPLNEVAAEAVLQIARGWWSASDLGDR